MTCCAGVVICAANAPAQNLFVGNGDNILEFTPGGTKSTFATESSSVYGLAFNSAGDLFVSLPSAGDIYEITPRGTQTVFASGLADPLGLAFNSSGNLFVANSGSGDNILEFAPNGAKSTFAPQIADPSQLAVDGSGNVYVTSLNNIYKYTASGAESLFVDGSVGRGIAVNSAGDVFSGGAAGNTNVIYEFSPSGTRSIFAGNITPTALAFNSAGDLFAATDNGSNPILEITPAGVVSTFVTGVSGSIPDAMAVQPVPDSEPSMLTLLASSFILFVARHYSRH